MEIPKTQKDKCRNLSLIFFFSASHDLDLQRKKERKKERTTIDQILFLEKNQTA